MHRLRRLVPTLLVAVVAACAFALPASSNGIPEAGARIGVFPAEQSFAANTAFHVTHGLFCAVPAELSHCINTGTHFDLFVNDVQQTSIVDIDLIPGDPEVLRKFNLTNFPNGLPAGTYTFTGQFFDDGQLVLTRTSIVHFT
jgi:hypothetical protein